MNGRFDVNLVESPGFSIHCAKTSKNMISEKPTSRCSERTAFNCKSGQNVCAGFGLAVWTTQARWHLDRRQKYWRRRKLAKRQNILQDSGKTWISRAAHFYRRWFSHGNGHLTKPEFFKHAMLLCTNLTFRELNPHVFFRWVCWIHET